MRGLTPRLCHLSRAGVHFTHTVPHSHYTRPRPLLQVRHTGKRQWERILTSPKMLSGKTPGQRGRGKNVKGGAKRVPPLIIYTPKPRKRVPLLYPVPFCPDAFLFRVHVIPILHAGPEYIIDKPVSLC